MARNKKNQGKAEEKKEYTAVQVVDGRIAAAFTAEEVAEIKADPAQAEIADQLRDVVPSEEAQEAVAALAEAPATISSEELDAKMAPEVSVEEALAQAKDVLEEAKILQPAALQVDDLFAEITAGILRNNHGRDGQRVVNELGFAKKMTSLTEDGFKVLYFAATGTSKDTALEKLVKTLAEHAHTLSVKGVLGLGGIALYQDMPTDPSYAAFAMLGVTQQSFDDITATNPELAKEDSMLRIEKGE